MFHGEVDYNKSSQENKKALSPFYHKKIFWIENECKSIMNNMNANDASKRFGIHNMPWSKDSRLLFNVTYSTIKE